MLTQISDELIWISGNIRELIWISGNETLLDATESNTILQSIYYLHNIPELGRS